MSDLLRGEYINSLPQPLFMREYGDHFWWPVYDIDLETGLVRIDVMGKLQPIHIGDISQFRDGNSFLHDSETFYSDFEKRKEFPMTANPEALARCPFCGGTDIDPQEWLGGNGKSGPGCPCGAIHESIAAWNTRYTPPRTYDSDIAMLAKFLNDGTYGYGVLFGFSRIIEDSLATSGWVPTPPYLNLTPPEVGIDSKRRIQGGEVVPV